MCSYNDASDWGLNCNVQVLNTELDGLLNKRAHTNANFFAPGNQHGTGFDQMVQRASISASQKTHPKAQPKPHPKPQPKPHQNTQNDSESMVVENNKWPNLQIAIFVLNFSFY